MKIRMNITDINEHLQRDLGLRDSQSLIYKTKGWTKIKTITVQVRNAIKQLSFNL